MLQTFRSDVSVLKEKLDNLQKKIIVGGENLLEKAEEQEKLLEASAKELEQRMTRQEQLQRELELKEVMFNIIINIIILFILILFI